MMRQEMLGETTIAKTFTWVSHERLELSSDDLHFQDSWQIGVFFLPENGNRSEFIYICFLLRDIRIILSEAIKNGKSLRF